MGVFQQAAKIKFLFESRVVPLVLQGGGWLKEEENLYPK